MNDLRFRRSRSRGAATLLGLVGLLTTTITVERAALAESAARSSVAASPEASVPSVKVELVANAPTTWTLRVTNAGAEPATVPADARLITLELGAASSPGAARNPARSARAARPIVCALPRELRPERHEVGTLALDPGKSVAMDFDPRLLCFSKRDAEALLASARVTARYSLLGLAPLPVASMKSLTSPTVASDPIELSAESKPPLRPGSEPSTSTSTANQGPGSQSTAASDDAIVQAAPRVDGNRAATVSVRVSVTNTSDRTRAAFVRPGSIGFLIEGPTGAFTCPAKGTSPIREMERTLTSHATASVDVLLGPTCNGRSFDRPGLYVVRPLLLSPKAPWNLDRALSGERVGLPSLIRLQTARRPLLTKPPRLE